MKVAIVGSRTFKNFDLLEKSITNIISIEDITEIVSGEAEGADRVGKTFATIHKLAYKGFPAQWRVNGVYDNAAGFKRNKLIVERADIVIAFWNGHSRGTRHTMDLAEKAGKTLYTILFDDVITPEEMIKMEKYQKIKRL